MLSKVITLQIEPHDPLIVRDGRPFGIGAGNRMYCLDWPFPSTLAGVLRSFLGKQAAGKRQNYFFNDKRNLLNLKRLGVKGPFPLVDGQLYFTAPRDLVVYEENEKPVLISLRPEPLREGEGSNLPHADLLWPIKVTKNEKPVHSPAFWSVDNMKKWLLRDPAGDFTVPHAGDGFLQAFDKEIRTHVSIDYATNLAIKERFFFSSGLVLLQEQEKSKYKEIKIGAQLEIGGALEINNQKIINFVKKQYTGKTQLGMHPFGGERRLALISQSDSPKTPGWEMPKDLAKALKETSGLRMVLATPAFFNNHWRPEWLDEKTLEGEIPGCQLKVKLRGACVGTWQALSGWDMENRRPKPVRKLVPAGSVYFFEVLAGDPGVLKDYWLKSVCVGKEEYDGQKIEQDRSDGLGLVLWGVWKRN